MLTLTIAIAAYRHVPTQDKPKALVVVVSSTGMWICYGLYEQAMRLWAQTVDTPIRVDLEIVAPLLYYSSLMLWRFAQSTTHESKPVT